jgi:hypothetical protein
MRGRSQRRRTSPARDVRPWIGRLRALVSSRSWGRIAVEVRHGTGLQGRVAFCPRRAARSRTRLTRGTTVRGAAGPMALVTSTSLVGAWSAARQLQALHHERGGAAVDTGSRRCDGTRVGLRRGPGKSRHEHVQGFCEPTFAGCDRRPIPAARLTATLLDIRNCSRKAEAIGGAR